MEGFKRSLLTKNLRGENFSSSSGIRTNCGHPMWSPLDHGDPPTPLHFWRLFDNIFDRFLTQVTNGLQPELVRGSLVTAPSLQTVSTNLSSSLRSRPAAGTGGRQQPSRQTPSPSSGNLSTQSRDRSTTSRIPTEDRVPENRNSYDNPGKYRKLGLKSRSCNKGIIIAPRQHVRFRTKSPGSSLSNDRIFFSSW